MQAINVIGALVFGALSALTGGYGVFNLVNVQQTMFGPARVDTGIPIMQLVLAAVLIGVAVMFARLCVNRCKRCAQDMEQRDS